MSLPIATRARLLLQASLISDAASMPLHWIYNQDKIQELISKEPSTAFFHTPSCPFYKYPTGVFSPYGAEDIPVLRSVAKVGGLDTNHLAAEYFDYFSSYDKEDGKGYVGRNNHVIKVFLEQRNAGKSWAECSNVDDQANGIAKTAVIVARYAGSPDLPTQIERMVRVLQNSELSVEASLLVGKIIERALLTNTPPNIILQDIAEDTTLSTYQRKILNFFNAETRVHEWVRYVTSLNSNPPPTDDLYRNGRIRGKVFEAFFHAEITVEEAVNTAKYPSESDATIAKNALIGAAAVPAGEPSARAFASAVGLSCILPDALLNVLFVWKTAKSLEDAVNLNNEIGGDNCSRIMTIAAAYGASATSESVIPSTWIEKVRPELWNEVVEAADKIVNANPNLQN